VNAATLREAIGGPDALTGWSLVVLLPLGVLASTLWGLRNGLTLATWLPVMIGFHLFLILPFWVCRRIMIRASAKGPRPWLGLGIFAFLGGLRAFIGISIGALMGVALPRGAVIDFVPQGIGTGIAILGVVAVVVHGNRRHRAVVEQLATLDAQFERAREFDEAELADVEARSVAHITSMLELELRRLQSEVDKAPEDAAAQLRTLASDIVRPLSHELAQGDQWIQQAEDATARAPRWERLKEVIADVRPANPLVPFLLIELIALPTAISERVGGVAFATFVMLVIGITVYAGSWAVARLWPVGRTTVARFGALVVLYVIIGTLAAWVAMIITQWFAGVHSPIWTVPFLLVLTSMGASFTTAIQAHQRDDEARMAVSVARNAQLNAQVRERTRRAQRRVAKLLHSGIQAELIASAMLLAQRASGSSGSTSQRGEQLTDASQELDRLTFTIRERLAPSAHPVGQAKERIRDLTSLWSGAVDVALEVDGEAWAVLDQDPVALDSVMDVVAEGLTNAVCHGDGSQVSLRIQRDADGIVTRVTSRGRLAVGSRAGLGSSFLDASTREWQLSEEAGEVHLTASVGVTMAPA
jgi:signal transduction histidine kinase